jgi:uncharacterized protein YcfJ
MKENKMFKTLITTTIAAAAFASSAFAGSFTVEATVTDVAVMKSRVAESVPTSTCETVRVPITETRRQGGSGGDALAGMIIGGLIGKGATGNDQGAAVGAVIGGMMGAEGSSYQVVTGYRNEQQCYETYTTQWREVIGGYEVDYTWNGLSGSVVTDTSYRVGDTILVNVTMN